ncbi:MAG: ribonucleoside-diphosphate reductase [Planctomycetes bacterium RBG_13_62_9]|nr:MAG: ribonucleoside-diphosphate reductase [Planctomycetes bacterium RBG_13_62_9]
MSYRFDPENPFKEEPTRAKAVPPIEHSKGLPMEHSFSSPGVHPFEQLEWEMRSAKISSDSGEAIFEQDNIEVPVSWSQLATKVVASKYFYGDLESGRREHSVKQLVHRVCKTIADRGLRDGYFANAAAADTFYHELTWLCVNQYGSFNSPVWFNVGLYDVYGIAGSRHNFRWDPHEHTAVPCQNSYEHPQAAACFIQSVKDSMEDIMRLATSEAMLFKHGSGTGTDLSTLRSSREKLAGGGKPSGPLSFMRVYDQIAAVIKSGGKTRRAAKMQSLKVTHPDIKEFITAKTVEEKKAWALIEAGYSGEHNSEAYDSVMFQNSNLSVRVTDEFMQAAEKDDRWATYGITTGEKMGDHSARELMQLIAEGARICGDPGVQYHSTINRWHTCPNSGPINASNPCVTGDTLVATAQGYRRIGDLVGQSACIIDAQGRPAWVNRIFKTGHKPVYELKTRCGYRVRLTADHRVLTLTRGDVPAAELTVDDVVTLGQSGFGDDFVPQAFGELLGAAVGDGCISRQPEQDFLMVTLGHDEAEVANRLQANIAECKQWLELEDGRALRQTKVVHTPTSMRVGTSVAAIIDRLQQYAVLDAGSENKRFTDAVFGLDRASQASILRGLFTTDGTVANYGDKSQYVGLDSTNRELLSQVQLLLLGFGIKAKLYENRRVIGQETALLPDGKGGTRVYPVRQMHSLRISRQSRVRFEAEIGFLSQSAKALKLAALNRGVKTYREDLSDRVASLTPCGTQDVFDLTEPGTQHFVAGGIVVHNCSEYMFIDDSACNLASLNLMKFRKEGGAFDVEAFKKAVRIFVIAQEILVDNGSYPDKPIAINSHRFRPLGLGYANLGSLVMSLALPYDSDQARALASAVSATLTGAAYAASAEIARLKGPFAEFEKNKDPMLKVINMHRQHAYNIPEAHCPDYLRNAAKDAWDQALDAGTKSGFRNAQTTVLAPTGTIGFMMDCDTTGVEPDIALVKYKLLAGGGMLKLVNRTVPMALERLGYTPEDIQAICDHIDQQETIEGAPRLSADHLPVFDCAFKPKNGKRFIHYMAHLKMMAAVQPFISGAISKTINMPKESATEEITAAYMQGWKLGLKAVAIYRDGSKRLQPVSTDKHDKRKEEKAKAAAELPPARPFRRRLPDTRNSITHKFSVAGHEGYLTVGLYEDGQPGELFITMAKEGSTVGGLMDVIGTCTSMALQYGVPLITLVDKFRHARFEPSGMTSNRDIPFAKSLIDYIFCWLGCQFIPGYADRNLPNRAGQIKTPENGNVTTARELVEKTQGLAHKIAEAKAAGGNGKKAAKPSDSKTPEPALAIKEIPAAPADRLAARANRIVSLVGSPATSTEGDVQTEAAIMQQFNDQFSHFGDDAPACDICGSITVRNGTCYKCFNCGNSMGCS